MNQEIKFVDSKKLSWNYLKQFHLNPPTETFPRTKKVVQDYINHKSYILTNHNSISEYITKQYFTNQNFKHMYQIVLNDFPYKLESNIKHYICWFNPFLFPNETKSLNELEHQIKIIIKLFNKFLVLGVNCIYFENKLSARSVPGVRHIHIFINE